jgi:hypothetical protein
VFSLAFGNFLCCPKYSPVFFFASSQPHIPKTYIVFSYFIQVTDLNISQNGAKDIAWTLDPKIILQFAIGAH